MLPTWDGEGWVWPQLEVKPSAEPGAGLGLFARVPLRSGTMIPYRGQRTARGGRRLQRPRPGEARLAGNTAGARGRGGSGRIG